MKAITTIGLLFLLASSASAEYSFITPETITYSWTVQTAQDTKIPKLNLSDIPVREAIEVLGDRSVFQLTLETQGVCEETLNEKITLKGEKIAWIEIVSVIADRIDADILITKGKVILRPQSTSHPQAEQVDAGEDR